MYKLVVVHKGRIQKNIPLRHSHMIIGRKSESDIQLEEKLVSGKHAEISIKNQHVYLKDLGSTNGTSVNGNPVEEIELQTGDQISIGNYKLIFVTEHGDNDDPDATVIVGQKKPPDHADSDRSQAGSGGKLTWTLLLIIAIVVLLGIAMMAL